MSLKPAVGEGRMRVREECAEQLHIARWVNSTFVFDHSSWRCGESQLRWTAPSHLIVLTDSGRSARTHVRGDGKLAYDGCDQPGVLTFVPAGIERLGDYEGVDLMYSALWIPGTFQITGNPQPGELPLLVNRRDPVIRTLIASLRDDVARGHHPDAAYVEHMAALIMMRIAAMGRDAKPTVAAIPLDRRRLRSVRDFIDAHLDGDIALISLAQVANLPIDTFARRFKAATGRPPYAYVIERRVERAETLLRDPALSIGEIALAVGFSSQSHLTTTMRRLRGITPAALRTGGFRESATSAIS